MKIALVVHDFDPGYGHGRYAVELASRIGAVHDVHVYASRFAVAPPPNVTFQRVPAIRVSAMLTILSFMRTSETLLQRRCYDIVHAQGLTCRHASVITAHICNAARQHQPGHTFKSRCFASIASMLERRFYSANRHARVIAVSAVVASELVSSAGVAVMPRIIYHGVDACRFHPATSGERVMARRHFNLPVDGWTWLFVGLDEVIRQLPSFPEALLLVVTRSRMDSYKRLASVCGVSHRVTFHGPEQRTELAYQAADVLVYPSSYDAFGMVVAEAMASGLPVVAGRNIGAAEWIEHGKNGLLCDAGDRASLGSALSKLSGNPPGAVSMGSAARETVLRHTWDACARSTLAVYEEVCGQTLRNR